MSPSGKFVTDEIDPAQQGTPMKIEADTSYRVRMATLTTDDPAPDAENMSDADLAKLLPPIENIGPMLLELHADECEVTIRTFPSRPRYGPHTRQTAGQIVIPARLLPLSGIAVEGQGCRPHLRRDGQAVRRR